MYVYVLHGKGGLPAHCMGMGAAVSAYNNVQIQQSILDVKTESQDFSVS